MVTPYTGTIVQVSDRGEPRTKRFAGSDVVGEPLTFPDLDDDAFFMPPNEEGGWTVQDVKVNKSATPTVVTAITMKKGSSLSELILDIEQLQDTTTTPVSRGQGLVGRRFVGGSRYAFVQS